MNWLIEHVGEVFTNSRPHIVYAHLMIPHPPLFLDSLCNHRYEPGLSGVFFQDDAWSESQRKQAYLDQASCVDRFIGHLIDQIPEDVVVVLISDHGPDTRDQLRRHPDTWDEADLIERMNILLAVKGNDGCSLGDQVVMPNIMRRMLSCMGDQEIVDVEDRWFKLAAVEHQGGSTTITEVDSSVVRSIVAGSDE